ncbi:hypothetical protein FC19_GL000272 [Liquorilactobacillus aquaticus DSM 21051]|uniref:NEAT domain-containing protein n=1 Tax=Liquorilactobacillus aquaticus DSM 21051 TaxID=1423725 RepID=A0A0R2D4B6_9LACO|nr:NEAT domain-containing protein [Liquorilactobacillus aquaticus]KRM96756.1 hypothetical protein FC19_GL000272 [Liquorilactobacillus aquaticus DSM 21051]
MKKFWVLGTLSAIVIWLAVICGTAVADTTAYHVNYTIRQPITNKRAEIDTYFNKPATVNIEDGHYKVVLSIVTNHDLGSFPFQILKINGLMPKIEKKTLGQQDYYTISFITQDVHQKIYGELKVDISSSNYHYQGGFNLDLDAEKIPELANAANEKASTADTDSSIAESTTGKVAQKPTGVAKNEAAGRENRQSKKTVTKNKVNNVKKASDEAAAKNKANKDASKKTNSNDTGKILLVIGIVLALGIGGWGLLSNYRG